MSTTFALTRSVLIAMAFLLVIYSAVSLFTGGRAYKALPDHSPEEFIGNIQNRSLHRVVVAAGDSLTQGTFSGDYVSILRSRLGAENAAVVNAGVNGATSQDLLARLTSIVRCQPDAATILIGTNDSRLRGPGEHLADFQRNLNAIVVGLQTQTHASIAILSIPPQGEDPDAASNVKVRRFNDVIHLVATERGVTYLPLYETITGAIADSPEHSLRAGTGPENLSFRAALRRFFLHQSWNRISEANGFHLLTDGIHMNDRAAVLTAALIERWLRGQPSIANRSAAGS